jgi:CubicO group peptidase (beta-lactamase class C family)
MPRPPRLDSALDAELEPLDLVAVRTALDAAVGAAVDGGGISGAVAIAGRADAACAPVVHGASRQGGPPVGPDTRFDLASLTKVVSTLPALLRLAGEGRLDLDAPLATWFPNAGWFRTPSLGDRTPRELLTHTSGLPAWTAFMGLASARRTVIGHALASELPHGRGEVVYSDLGFIVLGALVERVTGLRQDDALQELVTGPLGLAAGELGYRPLPEGDAAAPIADVPVAATEDCGWRMRLLSGEVHDEAAWIMGGVAGHAGLFGTAGAVAGYARAWLAGDAPWLPAGLRAEATRRATRAGRPARGLGWALAPDGDEGRTDPAQDWRGPRGYGHTGFTGTSLWIDPEGDRFCVLLTNRVHPTRHGGTGIAALRRAVHAAVFGGSAQVPP